MNISNSNFTLEFNSSRETSLKNVSKYNDDTEDYDYGNLIAMTGNGYLKPRY